VVLAYGLVTTILWLAPLYGWVLLISAWAKRAPFLWAILPPLGIALFEHMAFNRGYISSLLLGRLDGGFDKAFVVPSKAALKAAGGIPHIGLAEIDAGKFLSTPGLWIGLLVAAAFFVGAVRLRRRREPA
jgi:ABC-2 type transport system permease protein